MKKKIKSKVLFILTPATFFLANKIQGWKFSEIVLKRLGNYLVLKSNSSTSDIIVVLGGGSIQRIRTGVRLYQKGFSPKLLIYKNISLNKFLLTNTISTSTTEEAVRLGVNIKNIIHVSSSRTTEDEAKFFHKIVVRSGLKSAIIVTDNYHTRRASILFRHFVRQHNFRFSFYSPTLERFDPEKWWHKKEDTKVLIYEYLALIETFIKNPVTSALV